MKTIDNYDYAIIGGGPSGLSLATQLKQDGAERVIIIEREAQAGGIPRHCGHYVFGVIEGGTPKKGPDYARWNVRRAERAGVTIWTQSTALTMDEGRLVLTTPQGIRELSADKIILATGAREASRVQRNIGGFKLKGVLSTGALQSLVYLAQQKPFSNPVIIGSELVSFSAINTCKHMGITPNAMLDFSDRPIARSALALYPKLLGIPSHYGISDLNIYGDRSVEYITYRNARGKIRAIECDGVIISGAFRPEASIARQLGLTIDANSGGPQIDQFGKTSSANIYAVGNGLRPIETSDWCWREGKALAAVLKLSDAGHPEKTIHIDNNAIKYVVPQRISASPFIGAHKALQVRLNRPHKGSIVLKAGEEVIARKTIRSRPERRILIPLSKTIREAAVRKDITFTLDLED